MATLDLEIHSLAGALCSIKAGLDWRLNDLHQAVAKSTGIPADEQRLVADACILAPPTMLLRELLPEGITDVLCVRCKAWIVLPFLSRCNHDDRAYKNKCRSLPISPLTIEEAKSMCTDELGFWGFTYDAINAAGRFEQTGASGFKTIGASLGRPTASKAGTTYVHLTPAGRKVLLQAIRRNKGKQVLMEHIRDLEVILAAVEEDALAFRYVCDDLRCNTQVAEIAVKANPFALQYAPDSVRDNRAIVSIAVQTNGFALQYASDDLKADRQLVLHAINSEPSALRYASSALRADFEICLAAVKQNGNILRFVDAQLQNRRDIVIAAVQQSGEALCWGSRCLRSDSEVIAIAAKQNPEAREYALLVAASAA
jgi:hypothetical protein